MQLPDFTQYTTPLMRFHQSPWVTLWCALGRIENALEALTETKRKF